MNKNIDLRWKTGDYYYDNYVPKLKDGVPQWVRDSYDNYRKQIEKKYAKLQKKENRGFIKCLILKGP